MSILGHIQRTEDATTTTTSATRLYEVYGTTNSSQEQVFAYTGIPHNDTFVIAKPFLKWQSISVEMSEKTTAQSLKKMHPSLDLGEHSTILVYKVTCNFAKPSSNSSTPTPNQLTEPAKISINTQPYMEEYDIDYSSTLSGVTENKKVENTAGEMMKTLPQRRKSKIVIAATKTIRTSDVAGLITSKLENSVNKGSVKIGYLPPIDEGILMCTKLVVGEQAKYTDEQQVEHEVARLSMEFEIDVENKHLHKYQSLGFHEKDGSSSAGLKPIKYAKNLPNGWPLDEVGKKKANVTDLGHMITRAPQPYKSWSAIASFLV